jgi:hypothetical protein
MMGPEAVLIAYAVICVIASGVAFTMKEAG